LANVAARGERYGVAVTRRHLAGYLHGMPGAAALRQQLVTCPTLAGCLAIIEGAQLRAA
jgi:tRNA-dihydrouridine synthase